MQKVNRNGIKPKKNINKESERNTMKHLIETKKLKKRTTEHASRA